MKVIRVNKRTRSDSAMASPHVGNATQAELDNLNPEKLTLSNPYFPKILFTSSRSPLSTSVTMIC